MVSDVVYLQYLFSWPLRPQQPPSSLNGLQVRFDPRFHERNLGYSGMYVHIAWNGHLGGHLGHGGLHTSDFKFEFDGLNNQRSDLKFRLTLFELKS